MIVSENTFEPIEDAEFVARELYRILKPGRFICARTPNRTGYLRLLAELVPKRLHAKVLEPVQPERKAENVCPTVYKMDSPRHIKQLFPTAEVVSCYTMEEPSYFFGNRFVYAGFKALQWLLPSRLSPAISSFIRKP